jgi:hypothetical protein
MIAEIPPAITCFISMKRKILHDHAAACAGAAHQDAQGPHSPHKLNTLIRPAERASPAHDVSIAPFTHFSAVVRESR